MLPMPVLNTYSQCPRKSETSKMNFRLTTFLILFLACSSPVAAQDTPLFPYRAVPQTKPEFPLSKAMVSVYEGNHKGLDCFRNELFTNFKYTPLKGFDLGSRRDLVRDQRCRIHLGRTGRCGQKDGETSRWLVFCFNTRHSVLERQVLPLSPSLPIYAKK